MTDPIQHWVSVSRRIQDQVPRRIHDVQVFRSPALALIQTTRNIGGKREHIPANTSRRISNREKIDWGDEMGWLTCAIRLIVYVPPGVQPHPFPQMG